MGINGEKLLRKFRVYVSIYLTIQLVTFYNFLANIAVLVLLIERHTDAIKTDYFMCKSYSITKVFLILSTAC